ncbi:hypothetical protein C7H19_01165 [Aphanothece hegewaldii CCALA 016]|uniref:O-antigen ligase-related domain-containing protein n=1 Tax=Aphanothece hegewaldii CCALA 016 TaxID=2107694 RepID=A0A2T1M3N3_9CHRO|nr:O-antigen ligase family protein [Aphanothece hegewaldii]PSF39428.1 hypothetical protein C7H19_01165 [Aphanothece hegewaldii CCALA 016]
MTPQALFVIIAWLPLTFLLFIYFPPRTAIITSFVAGLLFQPQGAGFPLPLIPNYEGMVATCYGILLGILFFDFKRLAYFKPSLLDLPMLIWCICPIFSSVVNDLGFYDGINNSLTQSAKWGLPYILGRLYLNNLAGLKELALTILKGGLIYALLCLYEIRMSPQLHYNIYGYYGHISGVTQAFRGGSWRPIVFMSHGLVLAMWMMMVTLIALWLWQSKTVTQIWGLKIQWLVAFLVVTFFLIKSTGTYVYFLVAVAIAVSAKWLRNTIILLVLILSIIYYLFLNVTDNFDGTTLINWSAQNFSSERAQSLEFRLDNEVKLRAKAQERPFFGWGGWGRNRVYEEEWDGTIKDTSTTDSYWIIAYGTNGLVGLISFVLCLLLPVICFAWWRYPVKTWFHPQVAPSAVLAVSLALFMVDSLVNVTYNPAFPLISGGLTGLVINKPEQLKSLRKKISKRKTISKTLAMPHTKN